MPTKKQNKSKEVIGKIFGSVDMAYGLKEFSDIGLYEILEITEEMGGENLNSMIVLISNFRLDNHQVLEKFKTLCEGYEDCPPLVIALIGEFTSNPKQDMLTLKGLFDSLAKTIALFPNLSTNTHWLLIPGNVLS